jgi:signal transduction histidine kinase
MSSSADATVPLPLVLTNAAQVRALSQADAVRQLPVRLSGVVLLREGSSMTLMDDTAGVYVENTEGPFPNFNRGDIVEVEGFSDPGKFAPIMKAVANRKLGRGQIPEPQVVTYDDLLMGQFGSQWVQVSGVVRRSGPLSRGENWELWLAAGGGQLRVRLSKAQAAEAPVDAEVTLRGVCFNQFNLKRQALNSVLIVPRGEPVVVQTPAPSDPYDAPVRSISTLMQFSPERSYRHRVHVRGVVIHAGQGQFWIHDSKRGLRISSSQTNALEVGMEVDVLGFLTYGGYTPELEDAAFQIKEIGVLSPEPLKLTSSDLAFDHDAQLVSLEATLQEKWLALEGCRLTLMDPTNRFIATLLSSAGRAVPAEWLPGSRVRVTGICVVHAGSTGVASGTIEPQSFEMMMRSPADLEVLQPPPWWTPKRIAWLLAMAVGVLLCFVGIIVWIGRRRLRLQAIEQMKTEAEFSAVLNERNRMARELHDTLAQGLGAISMQLELAKRNLAPESASRTFLEEARSLARSNLAEARNAIWNMRSQVLETGNLATALEGVLRSMTGGKKIVGEMELRGQLRRLAPLTENNLLRIGQEAIINAIRHADASHVRVVLVFEERQVQLSVQDDGKGFDPLHPPPSSGGLGLVGMRERVAQMHGDLKVTSQAGHGTLVAVSLPMHGADEF